MNLKSYIPTYTKNDNYKFDYTFTVFTPVYNRADTLHRVFESLNAQTFTDFELVLINDGSTDNTHEVALQLIETANFKVNYINNTLNKHKLGCMFEGIEVAKGAFFLTLDSDDACIPEALQIFNDAYHKIPDDKKANISAVTGLCISPSGDLVGTLFPEDSYYSSTFERQIKNTSSSEKWGFTKTSILKGISINSDLFSRGLIPEGIIWEFISKLGYKTNYINEKLRIYYDDSSNRLSNADHEKNSFGFAIYSLAVLNWFYKDYFWSFPKYFLKRIYTLLRAAHYLPFDKSTYISAIDSTSIKTLFYLGWPIKRFLK